MGDLLQTGREIAVFKPMDPKAFKETYREQLDAAGWDEAERERVIDEVLHAYRLNTELFEDLTRAKAVA